VLATLVQVTGEDGGKLPAGHVQAAGRMDYHNVVTGSVTITYISVSNATVLGTATDAGGTLSGTYAVECGEPTNRNVTGHISHETGFWWSRLETLGFNEDVTIALSYTHEDQGTGVTHIVVTNEPVGGFPGGLTMFSGRTSNSNLGAGTVTMVLTGAVGNVVGAAIDDGSGMLSGFYSGATNASPAFVMGGEINYRTGRWILALESGGFSEAVSAGLDYVFDAGGTGIVDTLILGEDGGTVYGGVAQLTGRLGNPGVTPGTVTLTFSGSGGPGGTLVGAATDDDNGALIGKYWLAPNVAPTQVMTGMIHYATGLWVLRLANSGLPMGSLVRSDYCHAPATTTSVQVVAAENEGAFPSGEAQLAGRLDCLSIVPGSVMILFTSSSGYVIGSVADDGDGTLLGLYSLHPAVTPDRTAAGTVNYSTGRWTLNIEDGGFGASSLAKADYLYEQPGDTISIVVNNEFGETCQGGNTSLSGATGYPDVVPGSLTMVFEGTSWVVGSVTDDGEGALTGQFTMAPSASPDYAMTGSIDYSTGAWSLNLDVPGFPVTCQPVLDYVRLKPYSVLDVSALRGGTVSPLGRHTYTNGSMVEVSTTASNYWRFRRWTGLCVPISAETNTTNTVLVERDMIMRANFMPELTGDGTPLWWLNSLGLPVSDAAAQADQDHDGLPTWLEYRYGSSPLQADSDGDGISDGVEVDEWGTHPASTRSPFIVDDDAPGDPLPQSPMVSDLAEDGSVEHPYDSIQKAIDALPVTVEFITTVVTGEDGGTYPGCQAQISGCLSNHPGIVPGSLTMVFRGSVWTMGTATDAGGVLVGTYSLVPTAPPDQVMTGTIDYDTGQWTMNLQAGGFAQDAQLSLAYTYLAPCTNALPVITNYPCVTQVLGPVWADPTNAFTGVIDSPSGIAAGSVQFLRTDVPLVADDGAGRLTGNLATGTIDYVSGLWSLTFSESGPSGWVTNLVVWYACTNAPDCVHSAVREPAVMVKDGYYVLDGNYDITIRRPVVVRSENGADHTIIRTFALGRGFLFDILSSWAAEPLIDGFTIETTADYGVQAGIIVSNGTPIIRNCVIADCGGYGIVCTNMASPHLEQLIIEGNAGGIACVGASSPEIVNCVISDNVNPNDGGGIYVSARSQPTVRNCTVVYNSALGCGGGVASAGIPMVWNTIVWGNSASVGDSMHALPGGAVPAFHCNVQGGWSGGSNIDADPLFVSSSNYHLTAASPCIDAGVLVDAPGIDFDGIERPLDGDNDGLSAYDIGAYEFVHGAADSDGDGQKDAHELIAGTSLTNAAEFLCILDQGRGGGDIVTWPSVRGRFYSVGVSSNLLVDAWDHCPNATGLVGTGYTMTYTNTSPPAGPRYYRIGVQEGCRVIP